MTAEMVVEEIIENLLITTAIVLVIVGFFWMLFRMFKTIILGVWGFLTQPAFGGKKHNHRVPKGSHHVFFTKIKGVTFTNPDGTSRQEILKRLRTGDPIELRPEPSNPSDPDAIAAYWRGHQLGYLNEMRAEQIALATERYPKAKFWGRVKAVTGSETRGVNIEVLCNGRVTIHDVE